MWNGILSDIFHAVLNLSVIGSLMIAGVFLIRAFCLKKGLLKSSIFVLLWMVILFRMMIPLSVPVPAEFQLLGFMGDGWPVTVVQQQSPGQTAPEQSNIGAQGTAGMKDRFISTDRPAVTDENPDIIGNIGNAVGNKDGTERDGPEYGLKTSHSQLTIYDILSAIWLAGAALTAVSFLVTWLVSISREKAASVFHYADWREVTALARVKREIPLKIKKEDPLKAGRRIPLEEGLHVRSPYVSGVFRPVIIVPARMQNQLSEHSEHMDHILLHELTHIRHWDNLKKVIAAAALCLHWFNPVFWFCWIYFQRDLECGCDEKVVELLGEQEKKKYAESLYEFACETQNVLLCHFSSSGRTAVHGRIKRILAGSPKASASGVLSLVMAFLLLVTGCAINPIPKVPEASAAKSFLVYAAADGLYRSGLAADSSEKIFEGERLSHPVLSQNGDMVMFRQYPAPELSSHAGLYVYHFGLKKAIPLRESSYSYCAGPDNTFIISTTDGKMLKAEFKVVKKDSADALEYQTEDISIWPEAVEKGPDIFITYANPKCSPDYRYLAYSVDVQERSEYYYSGGLYVLDLETGEAVTVVEPIRATDRSMGNDPVPGPWSRDGKILTVWNKPQSASLSADGVSCFFYHADTGQKTEYGAAALSYTENRKTVLAYDENISFSDAGTMAVLTGIGREMFYDKKIDLITDYSGALAGFRTLESITDNGLVPAMPQMASDGKTLYFAAIDYDDVRGYIEGTWTVEDYQNAYPLKRQLYSVALEDSGEAKAGEITQLTSDPAYRNENPVLLRDESRLVFGRANAEAYDGKMEIWIKDLAGGEEIKLAEWTEPEITDPWMAEKYNDYYGRGSWNGIFAIYDATK